MPSKLKILQTNMFTDGLNSDIAEELISTAQYRYALNIHNLATSGGQQGIIVNCLGTLEIATDLPEGDNVPLGAFSDTENQKFYWANYNSNGFHGWYMYDALLNAVIPIIVNKVDTGLIDILLFDQTKLILMIDILRSPHQQDLIYWVDGHVKQKKFNIQKALDKTTTGYGVVITAEDINAYKLASIFPPVLTYFTDTTRVSNYLYTYLLKASVRHWYDDGERNNWSEFSTVPLPQNESFTGNPAVSNVNNGLKINVETGSSIVTHIEIAIQIETDPFVSVIVLDKTKLGIGNNTNYQYSFYNDNASYSGLDQLLVQRAYSFMPRIAGVQSFTRNAMVYGKGYEGFENVDILVSVTALYSDLFIPGDTTNVLNDPFFSATNIDGDFTREGHGRRRNSLVRVVVGHDVVAGNYFTLFGRNGDSDNFQENVLANHSDTAITIANTFKQRLVTSGRVLSSSEDLPDTDIWLNTINGDGDVTFEFIWRGRFNENYTTFSGEVVPVSVATLKDTGQSISNQKSGGTIKYGILYWNEDTQRSNTYTDDSCVIRSDFVTQTNGFKKITHEITIMNQPPVWAQYYEIVRTLDLTYGNDFIQILIQKAIESQSAPAVDYVDLVIGSLYTYQRMYPNTVVAYEFEKNDRVRLIKKEDTSMFYGFIETIVLAFFPVGTSETFTQDVTTNQSNTVTIGGATNADNIGRWIVINDVEREIIGAPTSSTYTLAYPYGTETGSTETKYPSFKIVDKRGILRIRKPINITIEDDSLIEVYKPTQSVESAEKQFFLFGQKFAITDWGTDQRAHTGSVQNQDYANPVTVPAIVDILKGTTYVRQQQFPTNNQIPDTQVIIDLKEDNQYSDFYASTLGDNGKISVEDDGSGEILFDSRLRFSGNYIEGTGINGLNDFDNLSRKDYNDPYGAFMLLKFREMFLFCFKQFKTGYVPVLATVITDQANQQILGSSDKLLNEMQYFAWEGGVGNNPESYASDQTWQWFLSPNSGTDCRIGGDGILPTSQQFFLDTKVRDYINQSIKNSGFIFGGYDRNMSERILAFAQYNEYLYNAGFNLPNWQLFHADYPEGTVYEITQQPQHGTVTIDSDGNFVYTPSDAGSDGGYTGSDYFYYRWMPPGGAWSDEKRSCGYVSPADIPDPLPIYYNTEQYRAFSRSDCGAGYHGSEVVYVVYAKTYSSPFSQANADQQALDDITLNGQNYADDPANGGTCAINTPNAFTLNDLTGLQVDTLTVSNSVLVDGDYSDYLINVIDSEYDINMSGDWIDESGVVDLGSSVRIRRLTSPDFETTVNAQLQIGAVSDTWSLTTTNEYAAYGNVEMSGNFQRNNCSAGSTGTYVLYTVPADTYFANTQMEADDLATADVAANGQDNANANGTCLLDMVKSILVVDIFTDTSLDVCAYIDTPGVSESGNIVSAIGALNFYLSSENVYTAYNAYMLSSDNMTPPTTVRRFEFNIGKLIGLYPDDVAVSQFIFQIRGRGSSAELDSGVYQLKFPTQQMTMTGSPGTYIPSISPAGGPASVPWSSNVISGANGTVGVGVGAVILTFTYNRAANTVSLTTY